MYMQSHMLHKNQNPKKPYAKPPTPHKIETKMQLSLWRERKPVPLFSHTERESARVNERKLNSRKCNTIPLHFFDRGCGWFFGVVGSVGVGEHNKNCYRHKIYDVLRLGKTTTHPEARNPKRGEGAS